MTMQEAEENYKFVDGDEGYYMWHEIGEKAYNEYKAMQIPREVKAGWDEEMVEKAFDRLTASGPKSCESGDVRIIIDAISRSYTENSDLYAARLLNVILKKTEINDLDRIYLINDFGHQGYHNDSGVKVFFEKTSYGPQMDKLVRKLMDFTPQDATFAPFYERGVSMLDLYRKFTAQYEKSYAKWGKKE